MATQAVQLKVTPRTELGSRSNKRLRDQGLIPGVIYGHKEAVVPVTINRKEVSLHLSHGAHVFSLNLQGQDENVLVKDVQFDHLGMHVIHIDFTRVSLDEKVTVTVPIELKGEPRGESEGGVLHQNIADIEVECRVLDIPEKILHNVSDMGLNDVLHVKDLKLPEGVKAIAEPEQIVAAVREVQEEVSEAQAEAGGVEPEIIGRKPGEEGAEGADAAKAAKGGKPEAKGGKPEAKPAKPEKK